MTFGSYRVLRRIGEGGMGEVYEAEHVLLGRRAAVKVLLPEHSANRTTVERFFNEARAATSIKHRGIVEIYDFGYATDGTAYIAMEMLEGESLAARMHRGTLSVGRTLAIARQIAGALAAAHQAGIVHRDLKPDNIFIVPDGEVAGGERIKLLDFGIAKLVNAAGRAKTSTGAVLGTPTYMAPEQCRGVAVDHHADLYALGCIVFEMLSGRPPFSGEGAGDVLAAHIHLPPPLLRSLAPFVPPSVEGLVARLLVKEPTARTSSANVLVAEIDRLPPAELGAAGTRTLPRRPRTQSQIAAAVTTLGSASGATSALTRRRAGLGLAAVAVAALIAGALALRGDPPPAARVAAPPPGPEVTALAAEDPPATAPTAPLPTEAPAPPAVAAPPVDPAPAAPSPPATTATRATSTERKAAPRTTRIAIDSQPRGAVVIINDVQVGKTPYAGSVAVADSYRVTLHKPQYTDATFVLTGKGPLQRTYALAPDPNATRNPFEE